MNLALCSVLVVDDSKHMRALNRTILRSFGVRAVMEANDGADAGEGDALDSTITIRIISTVLAPADTLPTAVIRDLTEPGTLFFLSTAGAGTQPVRQR